jgi:hypothetical protein
LCRVNPNSGRDAALSGLAKWNGSAWAEVGQGLAGSTIYQPWVTALAVSGPDLYVGGSFTNAGGIAATNIAKWNGSTWSALGAGMNDSVSALAVSGSDLYAGGAFTNAGGIAANHLAKWDGNAWSALGSGMDGTLRALAVSGPDLYAAADWGSFGSVARWNGSAWSAVGSLASNVMALAVSGSDLYVGGSFTTDGGVKNIATWNGSTWLPLGSGTRDTVWALAVSGSDLYAGGAFTMAGGKASAYMAKAIVIAGDWLTVQGDVPGPHTNTLTFVGVPNARYVVRFTTTLTAGPWFTLATNTVGANGRGTLMDCTATNAQRYYRVSAP